MAQRTLLINQTQIRENLIITDYIHAMEKVHAAHANGKVIAPGIIHGDAPEGEYHIKTGGLLSDNSYFGLKANGGFFNNSQKHGLPNILGVIYLSDANTGFPLAVLDSVEISKNRTAAASAVAAKYLARADASKLCICGTGTQARIQAEAISKTRELEAVSVFGRDPAKVSLYCEEMSATLGIPVQPVEHLPDTLRNTDIIVTCTPSNSPLIKREWVAPGTFIAAVGADSPGKQELDPTLVAAAKVVPDVHAQSCKVGELQHPLKANLMTEADVHGEIGQIITGQCAGRENNAEIIIYDSTGTALQDVAAAAIVYEKLASAPDTASFDFFS